jgi:uncharacterized membrane protein YgcG
MVLLRRGMFVCLGFVLVSVSRGQVPEPPPNQEESFKNLPSNGSLLDQWKKRKPSSPMNINQEMLKNLMQQFGNQNLENLNPELLKDFIGKNPLFQDPDRLNEFKDFLEEFMEKNQGNLKKNPFQNLDADKFFQGLKQKQKEWQQENPQKVQPVVPPQNFELPQEKKAFEPPKNAVEFEKNMKGMFGDLDALKNLANDFADLNAKGPEGWNAGMPDWMPQMGNFDIGDLAEWGKAFGNLDLKVPDMNFNGPKFGNNGGGFGNFGGGGGGGGGFAGGGGGGGSLGSLGNLWILPLLIGIGVALYVLVMKYQERERQEAAPVLQKLPPIDPNEVKTRQDLVEAFDRMSLYKVGERVRVWNHRVIETNLEKIAGNEPQAARELTNLYEQARYLPAHFEMSESQLSQARQHLRTLGEASGQ